jgi:hypothetical protein
MADVTDWQIEIANGQQAPWLRGHAPTS